MSQGCLLSEAPELLDRLPDWGTTADGVLFELQMPELLTGVRDGSASPPRGMPTPRAADSYERRNRKTMIRIRDEGGDMTLTTWAKVVVPEMLATPTAWLGRRPSQAIGDPERWHDPERSNELSDQIAALLPTPTAQAAKHGATPDIHANGFGSNLWDLPHLLPTPTAQDGANNAGPSQWNRNSDPLNVVAVKLSGGTTPLPLNDGNEPSADQHPHPPTTGNCPAGSSSG